MSAQGKPSIVFCHDLWADGSCFAKLIPALRAAGHEVITSQHGLDTHQGDVDCAVRTLGRVSSPVILVGHSYGGSIITAAGIDDVAPARLSPARPPRLWAAAFPRLSLITQNA